MTPHDAPDFELDADALSHVLPAFTVDEQRAALTLYWQLAKGQPVTPAAVRGRPECCSRRSERPPRSALDQGSRLQGHTQDRVAGLPRPLCRADAPIGASAVGVELAQMFARLGVAVTILEAMPRLVPNEDPDVGADLGERFTNEGLAIRTGVTITRVERAGAGSVHLHDHRGGARPKSCSDRGPTRDLFRSSSRLCRHHGRGSASAGHRAARIVASAGARPKESRGSGHAWLSKARCGRGNAKNRPARRYSRTKPAR